VDADPDSDEAIKAQIAECQMFLGALESGNLHIGAPYEGRTEARIDDLKRRIAMYQSILEKRHAAMPEDTDRVEGDGAAKAEAGAFPVRPTATLQGVEGVESAIGYGMGGFGTGALNTEALNDSTYAASLDIGGPPLSPETPLALRSLSEPVASTTPSATAGFGSSLRTAFGGMTAEVRASPEPLPSETTVILERRLSERPEDFREGARALAKAIADQIDLLNASKPNDPDALARHDEFVGFLQQIAERLDSLADALDAAINAASSERAPFLLGRAADVARSMGDFIREGLEKHRSAIQLCAVQVPAVWLSVLGLHWLGVDPTTAFCGVAGLMGWKTISKDAEKK